MNSVITANVVRFIVLVLLQGLILQNIGEGIKDFAYIHIIIYPLFILLLPLKTPRMLLIFLGFLIGIAVDSFYLTPGLHASASVFIAYARSFVLRITEPRAGYNVNYSPTAFRSGKGWFYRYAGILMAAHLFFYFSVEAFTFVYWTEIIAKTVVSFLISMLFIVFYQVIFNPKE